MLGRIFTLAVGRRAKWGVIGAWVALALGLVQVQPKLQERAADESDTFLVRGSDSAAADRLLDERFSVGAELATVVVYELPERDGTFLGGQEERIAADADAICASAEIEGLRAVFTPVGLPACDQRDLSFDLGAEAGPSPVSVDERVALTTVLTDAHDTPAVVRTVEAIGNIVEPETGEDALPVHVSGPGGIEADRAGAVEGIDEKLLAITALLVLVLLFAVYRSPLAAAVPLGVVAAAYLVAAGLVWGLVSAGATTISGQTMAILIVLLFGAGTDYCLLIMARFREELRRGASVEVAMVGASRRTGPAILSAGGIVVGVMLILGLADFNATREMGPVLALGMAVMVLAGLTLLPASLAALGHRAFWPARWTRERDPQGAERPGIWARTARLIKRRPAAVAAAVTVVLVAGALGNLAGRDTLDFTDAFRGEDPSSVVGAKALREHFPPGRVAPLDLVITEELAPAVTTPLAELPEVDEASLSATSVSSEEPVELRPESDPLIKASVVLTLDPFSQAAVDFIPRLRAEIDRLMQAAAAQREAAGREVAVLGGPAAETYDTQDAVAGDTRLIVPLALALVLAVLVLLLGAVVLPLYLVGTVVLSFLFALGVSSLVFNHILGQSGSDSSLPVFAFVFLVGLGVDYNIFLVGRIREECLAGLDTRRAALTALTRTGGVITNAGLILAGTFAALMALTFEALFQFGFVIALGLLVDTFLVRALLVPSIAVLLGERNWWPRRAPGKRRLMSL